MEGKSGTELPSAVNQAMVSESSQYCAYHRNLNLSDCLLVYTALIVIKWHTNTAVREQSSVACV